MEETIKFDKNPQKNYRVKTKSNNKQKLLYALKGDRKPILILYFIPNVNDNDI